MVRELLLDVRRKAHTGTAGDQFAAARLFFFASLVNHHEAPKQ